MSDAKFRAPGDNGGALAGLGEGLQQLGRAGSQFANEQDRINAAMDEAAVQQQGVAYSAFRNQRLQTGEGAFLGLKGLDALNARTDVEKSLADKAKELTTGLKTERSRAMFARYMASEQERDALAIGSHVRQATDTYRNSQSTAFIAQAGNDMRLAAGRGDADGAAFARSTLTNAIAKQYRDNGLPEEAARVETGRVVSGTLSAIIDDKMLSDPIAAAAYMSANEADLLPGDAAKLRASLKAPMLARQASAVLDGYPGYTAGEAPASAPHPTGDALPARMIAITAFSESGGRERNADGSRVTSPKGAQGVMQVMPNTGRDPGFGVKASDGSPADDARMGRDYLAAMMKRYGNDPAKAWAAYNMGPGNLDAALSNHGAAWLSKVNPETQGYVRKNMAMLGGDNTPTFSPRRDDLNGIYQYIEKLNLPFDLEKAALAEADSRVARNDRLLARQESDAERAAFDAIDRIGEENFTSISQLPPGVRRGLSPQTSVALQSRAESNAKGKAAETHTELISNLRDVAMNEPEAFKAVDLRRYQGQITASEMAALGREQKKLRATDALQAPTVESKVRGVIQKYAADIGLDLSKSKGKYKNAEDRKHAERIYDMMSSDLADEGQGQKALTEEQYMAAFRRATQAVKVENKGWFSTSWDETPRFRVAPGTAIRVGVPDADRNGIIQSYRRQYGRMPTEQQIAQVYMETRE